jgi:DNA-directed RNA polymerase specialized sigma24 family protein
LREILMTELPQAAAGPAARSRTGRFIRVTSPEPTHRDALLRTAIARAKQGDIDAVHFLYVRFADDVYVYVNSIVRDSHAAEDVTQNLFGRLMTTVQGYQQGDVHFAAWILLVARNAALEHMRAGGQIPDGEGARHYEGSEQLGSSARGVVARRA